jgi:hypothetical protein
MHHKLHVVFNTKNSFFNVQGIFTQYMIFFLKWGGKSFASFINKEGVYKKVKDGEKSLLSRHDTTQLLCTRNDPQAGFLLNLNYNYKRRRFMI